MTIIAVYGVSGSGKSYIVRNTKNKKIIIKDTDDFYFQSMKDSLAEDRPFTNVYSDVRVRKYMKEFIKKHSKKTIVFAGVWDVPDATQEYFIKIPKKDLPLSYRRFMKRELEKIIENKQVIIRSIEKTQLSKLNMDVFAQTQLVSPFNDSNYQTYVNDYHRSLDDNESMGVNILSQAQIMDKLEKI